MAKKVRHPKVYAARGVTRASQTRAVGAVANNCLVTMMLAPMWIVLGLLLAPYTLFKRAKAKKKPDRVEDFYQWNPEHDEDHDPGCLCAPILDVAAPGESKYAEELLKDLN